METKHITNFGIPSHIVFMAQKDKKIKPWTNFYRKPSKNIYFLLLDVGNPHLTMEKWYLFHLLSNSSFSCISSNIYVAYLEIRSCEHQIRIGSGLNWRLFQEAAVVSRQYGNGNQYLTSPAIKTQKWV